MRIKIFIFLALFFFTYPTYSKAFQNKTDDFCKKHQFALIANTNMATRTSEGDFFESAQRGDLLQIKKFWTTILPSYKLERIWPVGKERVWAVRMLDGNLIKYDNLSILYPITSRKRHILNVDDPCGVLRKLGMNIPTMPDGATQATVTQGMSLKVLNNEGLLIDILSQNQSFYILDIKINKFNSKVYGERAWAKIYCLNNEEGCWIPLTDPSWHQNSKPRKKDRASLIHKAYNIKRPKVKVSELEEKYPKLMSFLLEK